MNEAEQKIRQAAAARNKNYEGPKKTIVCLRCRRVRRIKASLWFGSVEEIQSERPCPCGGRTKLAFEPPPKKSADRRWRSYAKRWMKRRDERVRLFG